jgi:hypothetical protein
VGAAARGWSAATVVGHRSEHPAPHTTGAHPKRVMTPRMGARTVAATSSKPIREHLSDMPVIAADYPLLDVFWTMMFFVFWLIWIWILVGVLTDIFRRRDLSGWGKAAWTFFVIVLPYLGVFAYLIAEHDGMAERSARNARSQRAEMDDYVRSVAGDGGGGPAGEIQKAKTLLDNGTIDQTEYESIKARALAA